MIDLFTRLWDSTVQLGPAWTQSIHHRAHSARELPDASPEGYDEAMQPVSMSIVHGLESTLLEASISASQVAAYVQLKPDRRIGFVGIDPTQSDAAQVLDEALSLGLRGVTISPVGQGFLPTDSRAMKLFEACVGAKLPVYVETSLIGLGPSVMEAGQPFYWDEVARSFPDLKVVIGSAGWPWFEETLTLIGKHANVFADISHVAVKPYQLETVLTMANEERVLDKFLFASGYPFQSPYVVAGTLLGLRNIPGRDDFGVPREHREKIVQRDSLKLLGLC